MAGTLHPIWPNHVVIAVADALGDTSFGLTGSEIGRVLGRVRVPEIDASATKRHRLCFTVKDRRPPVRINDFGSKSETSEHTGFANLLRGLIGTFRNTTAHAPRASWPVSEADALDVFSTLSFLHRRLNDARVRRIVAE